MKYKLLIPNMVLELGYSDPAAMDVRVPSRALGRPRWLGTQRALGAALLLPVSLPVRRDRP